MKTILWTPQAPERSSMAHFIQFINNYSVKKIENYQSLHSWSVQNPELFWGSLCDFFNLKFHTPPSSILKTATNMMDTQWFAGATFNFAEKLLIRKDDHPACIILDEHGTRSVVSYWQLNTYVEQCAAGLKQTGIIAGDRVVGILPNSLHALIAMLATTAIGAIWSCCSPDFGANAIIDRLGQLEPKLLFACGQHTYQGKTYADLEKLDLITQSMPSLKCTVLINHLPKNQRQNSMEWNEFLIPNQKLNFIQLPFNHPIYILFSSGTTGRPKCIIHGAGGTLLQHVKELALHTDIQAQDNLFFYTTCGWMMWNWMVSALALGATLTLYDGSPTYPSIKRLFNIIDQEKVSVFGTSAKFLSSVEKTNLFPAKEFKLDHLRCILSTGSALLPKNYDFVYQHIKTDVQLSSISGGTDIVSCFALGNPMLPVYRGQLQCLGLGMDVDVFNEQGQSVRGAKGELVCKKPFPSMPVGFWNDLAGNLYKKAYFDRFDNIWAHGDFAEITEHHGLIIYGRSDTVLNPGGVRIGTAEIYRQIEGISEILDSVVIGQDWLDDVRVILFVKLIPGLELSESLKNTIRQNIRKNASPRHVPDKILQVDDIPRTFSGKIVEIAIRQMVNGEPINNLDSLINPESLVFFKDRAELCV